MLCKTCDTRNDAGASFCRNCGMTLLHSADSSAAPQPAYTFTSAPMTGPTCSACARANPTGARYCVFCARQLVQPASRPYGAPMMQPALAYGPPNMLVNYGTPQPVALATLNVGELLIRVVWFCLIGWWLALVWTIVAWLFNLTLIGLPVGLMMLHAIPQITTLHRPTQRQPYQYSRPSSLQHPLALRALWFLLIGWWASLVWSIIAWAFSLTLILSPISFWMWNRVPTITTLASES